MRNYSSDFKLPAIGSGDWDSRHSQSLRFPVSLGSKHSDIWPAIVPELQKNGHKQKDRIQECAILRFRSANRWSTLIIQLMNLPLNTLWQSLLILIICINYLFTTYVYMFENKNTSNVILKFCILDIIYLTDFVICLLQRHLKNLAIHINIKLRSVPILCVSAVTLVPVELVYILTLGEDSDSRIAFWLRSITFLRFCNIYIYFKNWKSSAGRHRYLCFLLEFIIVFIHLLHTFSFIWYSNVCVGRGCTLNWYSPFEKEVRCFRGYCEKTWKSKITEEKDSGRVWYLTCLYFWVGIMTGSANGDILPVKLSETIFCIFGMIISLGLVTGIYIGRLINFYVDSKKRKTLFSDQLTEIRKYLRNVGVSKDIQDETMKYYNILWKKKKGVVETSTFYSLPLSFQREVCYDIFIDVFHQSIILRNLDEAFLREISLRMKCTFHLPGEVIFQKNLVKQMMIYVKCGTLEILSDEDDESPIISFTDGTFLGEIALAVTVPAKATVRAATYAELQILNKVDFLRVINDFPEAFKIIQEELFRRNIGAVSKETDELKDHVILNNFVSQTQKKSSIRQLKKVLRYQKGIQIVEGSFEGAGYLTKDNLNETFVSLYTLTDNISKSSEPIICLSASFPWILLPDSSLRKALNACVIATVFLVAVIYPYYSIFHKKFPSWLIFFGHIVDIFYAMDCFVQCITMAEKDNIKKVKIKDIINYRLDHLSFYLDLFSVIPFEYGAGFVEDPYEEERIACLLRLNRLLRCYKIVTVFLQLAESMSVNIISVTVLKCQIYTIIFCVWLGSILYLMTCFTDDCYKDGWYHHKIQFELERKDTSPCYETPFLLSLYYGLSILLCIGFGDIYPASKWEVVCVIFFIVFGFLFSGFLTSSLSGSFILSRRSFSSYQEMVQAIKKYMKDNMMNKNIQQRVCDYFHLQWNYNSGILITEENNGFTVGSKAINQKIVTKERMDYILCVPMFQNLDSDFLQIIATGSRVLTLPPNEYVTYIGEISREMYIITQGYCEIAGLTNKMLGPSSYFGDLEMLFGIPSKQKVLTVTHCQLLNINYTVFSQAISLFPDIMNDLTNVINDNDTINQLYSAAVVRRAPSATRVDKLTMESNPMLKVLSKLKRSFVNVWKECRKTGEDYNQPFKHQQWLKIFKFLLLPITILPDGCCFKVWCTLRLISACFVGIFDPFFQSTGHYSSWIPKILTILTIFAYTDIYVMMLICYHNEMGILVKHPLYTASNYIKHNFIIDFLACFPVNFFLDFIGYKEYEHSSKFKLFLSLIKLNKILQMYRIPAHLRYFESDIVMVRRFLQLLKIVLISAITLNVLTSFLVSATCSYMVGNQAFPIGFASSRANIGKHSYMKCYNGSWFSMSSYKDFDDPVVVYFAAYFWVLSCGSALGMDDITAENGVELSICISFVIIGSSLFGYIIATIVSSNICIHNNIVYYREMMNELTSYMKAEKVNKDLQKSLINHFEYEWKRSAGYHPQKVFENLNSALMEDSVWCLYKQTLRAVPLFSHVEETFLRVMGKHMEEVYFLRGTTIIRSGDIQPYIYIIYRGKVTVTSRNNIETNMDIGGIFGNLKAINASQCFVTIKALRNVDTLMIRSETFYNILKSYPHIKSRLNLVLANVEDFLIPSKLNEVQSDEFFGGVNQPPKRVSQISEGEVDLNKSEDTSLSSSGTVEEEDSQTGRSFSLKNPVTWNNFAILPESMIFSVMGYTILIVSYINIIMVSYQITFRECSGWFIAISTAAEFIFYFNIVLELHQAYIGKYGETVTDPTKMRKRYFKNRTKVLVNVFCDSPLELISYVFDSTSACSIFRIVRLLHLGRIYYIFCFFNARENLLSSNRSLLRLSRMIITFTLLTHFLSCFLFIFKDARKHTPFETYIDCLHQVTIIASSVGYGKVGQSVALLIYSIVLMFINIIALAYFIADVTTILNNSTSSLVNYEYSINILKDVLLNNHLSNHQMKKVWQYVTKLWDKSRGNQMPRFVKKAPIVLQCDLMNEIYGEHIRKSYIFAELDDNFLRLVTACLQHNVHFEDNYIVQHGDTDQNMYFIHRGEVNVLTVHPNLTETIHDVLQPFDVFGIAQGLYHGLPHHFSFRAKTVVDILILNLNDWYFMLKYFPGVQKILYNRANDIYIGP